MNLNRLARMRAIQWLRHTIRGSALLFVIATPVVAHYRRALSRNEIEPIRTLETGLAPRSAMLALDAVFQGSAAGHESGLKRTLGAARGNNWSAQVGPVSMTDPLAAAESVAATRRVSKTLLLSLIIPVAATLLFGRFFCSWICPAGLLFDVGDRIRARLERWHVPVKHLSLWRGEKFGLLGAGLIVSFVLSIPILGYFYPPALVGREAQAAADTFFFGLARDPGRAGAIGLTTGALFLLSVTFFEILVARRMWCRYLCPGGALYTLLGASRVVKVINDESRCTHCMDCVKICPMGLEPLHKSPGIECDQCLLCVGHCEPQSLSLQLSVPRNPQTETNR